MKLSEKYDRLLNEYALCGGYEYESEVLKVISGLKIPESYLDIPFKQLSGGENESIIGKTSVRQTRYPITWWAN